MKIFDIGANRGLFTDKCLELFGNDLTIITIEANPNLSLYLQNKYINNSRVTVLNNLISEIDNSFVDFYISNIDTISTASLEWVQQSRFTGQFNWYQPIKLNSRSCSA